MAGSGSVWGIEIGQSALKALRCSKTSDGIVAEAFDYIEYPKILSQPDADADALVADALEQLLERNDIQGSEICISVPGQSGLAKFFKPPPVEVKKIADIVRYEARQQIPFDLADVVWDHQMMPGSMIEEGFALDSEVGLFAMKREQAYRQLKPFDNANLEVDVVQLAPISLYNTIAYDRMHERVDGGVFDPDDPPKSTVVLSIGTDSSDLIVTNGFRIWQRSMPIGGNHFTRQLTKDLKLTFAKAEHLKRNAKDAADPKMVFQTMRPVFNDLVTEVQRSIGFFRSIDRKAEIDELLITGNTVKMPGLAAYLGKNLGMEVHVLDRFERLTGDDVMSIPQFRDNASTFSVCYGLCLQGLGLGQIHASLVPHEILRERMIRAKKPWTLAGLAVLMLGLGAHYWFTEQTWASTHENLWGQASSEVALMDSYSSDHFGKDEELNNKLNFLNAVGKELSGNVERRLTWLEIMRVINAGIPRETEEDAKKTRKELPLDQRKDIHVTKVETKFYEDLEEWYDEDRARRFEEEMRNWTRLMDRTDVPYLEEFETGPTESGWVIQINGYHYFNSDKSKRYAGNAHVRKYLTTYFLEGEYELPAGDGQTMKFTPAEMGLSYPLLLDEARMKEETIPNPDFDRSKAMADPEYMEEEPPELTVQRLDFTFQVVWKPNLITDRVEAKLQAEAEAAEAAAAEAGLTEPEVPVGDQTAMTP
ncbi:MULTISPECIES: type IV pilus assembly protein PilM [Crateriforma]|uniref:Competence protein A n=1 Tax=Crateriforma conspicua TaxID=2527996 RepID=A0A5C6FWN4_9PLAN|nr:MULTISPECIES: type IV pilus assembly protein PilM [Crateriforma]TWU66861.1 Competence protein A [Crateriforma conspicua]